MQTISIITLLVALTDSGVIPDILWTTLSKKKEDYLWYEVVVVVEWGREPRPEAVQVRLADLHLLAPVRVQQAVLN